MRRFILLITLQLSFLSMLFAQPEPCVEPAEMTPFCNEACIICDIDGFQGRHESNINGALPDDFCTTFVHNGQWIAFIAGSESLTVEIEVTNCVTGWGLEIGIYEGIDCDNFMRVSNCDTNASEGETAVLTTNVPLTIGQYYFIAMDGSGGDNCDWIFNVIEGTTEVDPLTESGTIEGDETVCPDITTQYFIDPEEGATIFDWTLNGNPIQSNGPLVDITWVFDGQYELCVTASNVCDEATPSCKTITVTSVEPQFYDEIVCDDMLPFMIGDSIILTETGDYEFNYLTDEGCDSTIFVMLEVFEADSVEFSANLCAGDTLFIGDAPYTETGVFIEVLPNYVNCDSTVILDLFVIECEIIGQSNEIPVICFGDSTGMIEFSVENGTPPFDYEWKNLESTLAGSGSIGALNETAVINGLPIGTYIITINDTFGNDVVLIQVVTQPVLLTNDWLISDYDGNSVSCFQSADGTLEVIPIGGAGGYMYSWNTGNETALITDLPAGDYEVTITDAFGCTLVVQNSLSEPPPIVLNALFNDGNCDGPETGEIEVISATGGTAPYTYSFNNQVFDTVTTELNLPRGTYSVVAMDANGCTTELIEFIDVPVIPIVELGPDQSIFLGEETNITAASNIPLDSVMWSNEPGLDCYDCPRPVARPMFETTYTMTAISDAGCIGVDDITISIIDRRRVFAPNIFSPNDDGINDIFTIYGGVEAILVTKFDIFSRWGEHIYTNKEFLPNSIAQGWDGRYRDERANSGIYTWTAEIEFWDGLKKTYSGDVMLVR